MKFAKQQGIPILSPKGQLVTQNAKEALEAFKKDQAMGKSTYNAKTEIGDRGGVVKDFGEVGTVGAVAIDKDGNIAAATSTGGMTGKMVGRIGDSPILGSGTYADNNAGWLKFYQGDKVTNGLFQAEYQQPATVKLLCDTMLRSESYKESSIWVKMLR